MPRHLHVEEDGRGTLLATLASAASPEHAVATVCPLRRRTRLQATQDTRIVVDGEHEGHGGDLTRSAPRAPAACAREGDAIGQGSREAAPIRACAPAGRGRVASPRVRPHVSSRGADGRRRTGRATNPRGQACSTPRLTPHAAQSPAHVPTQPDPTGAPCSSSTTSSRWSAPTRAPSAPMDSRAHGHRRRHRRARVPANGGGRRCQRHLHAGFERHRVPPALAPDRSGRARHPRDGRARRGAAADGRQRRGADVPRQARRPPRARAESPRTPRCCTLRRGRGGNLPRAEPAPVRPRSRRLAAASPRSPSSGWRTSPSSPGPRGPPSRSRRSFEATSRRSRGRRRSSTQRRRPQPRGSSGAQSAPTWPPRSPRHPVTRASS